LARSLLRARLVDELRLVIAPAVAHRGRRLFDDQAELLKLELTNAQGTPSGALLCDYRIRAG
jgi:dihydrofolate reductase